MGLAPYGKTVMYQEVQELVNLKNDGLFELNLDFFSHQKEMDNILGMMEFQLLEIVSEKK